MSFREFLDDDSMNESKCQCCKIDYSVDLNIPDDLWLEISPKKSEAGLLCPGCIGKRIELLLNKPAAFNVMAINRIK